MPQQPVHIEQLAEAIRDAAKTYTQLLLQFFDDRLLGLTFYGAAVAEDYDIDLDRARSVVVLERISLDALRELARHGPHLGRMGLVAPVIMTPGYIHDSLDTFSLELLEIEQRSVTILGKNFFVGLDFEDEHVRLQCERELKTLMIGLRQGLLAAGGRESLLGQLEQTAAETLQRTMRGLAWLKGERQFAPIEALVDGTEAMLERSLPGVRETVACDGELGWEAFVRLYQDLEILRERVDAW